MWRGREEIRIAHEAVSPERERPWRLATSVYPTFDMCQERTGGRRVPVMVPTPDAGTEQ
jgi:hypothetical protein